MQGSVEQNVGLCFFFKGNTDHGWSRVDGPLKTTQQTSNNNGKFIDR